MLKQNGLSLLLYKDARVDQNILDEVVGPLNWQRHHTRDNANCIVSIWDDEKKQWIEKEDTGTESNTEKEKGLASDSFKRACFNFGIGRELYSAPFIWISADKADIKQNEKGKLVCNDRFVVSHIGYDDARNITALSITNTRTGAIVYKLGAITGPAEADPIKIDTGTINQIRSLIALTESDENKMCQFFKIAKLEDMTMAQSKGCISLLNNKATKKGN
jgi:hypothetical protein